MTAEETLPVAIFAGGMFSGGAPGNSCAAAGTAQTAVAISMRSAAKPLRRGNSDASITKSPTCPQVSDRLAAPPRVPIFIAALEMRALVPTSSRHIVAKGRQRGGDPSIGGVVWLICNPQLYSAAEMQAKKPVLR